MWYLWNIESTSQYNELKGEHLASSEYTIQTCIHNSETVPNGMLQGREYIDYGYETNAENIRTTLVVRPMLFHHNIVLSHINASDKYSLGYYNCIWMIGIWEQKDEKRNISFLTHLDPRCFLSLKWEKKSKKELELLISDLKNQSKEKTIDIVMLWWKDTSGLFQQAREYRRSICFLNDIVKEILGYNATVIGWPSIYKDIESISKKHILLDTQQRHVHFFKNFEVEDANTSINGNEISQVII